MHPEERRIAGLLRELIVQSGASLETLEQRLGWEPGHLSSLLDGRVRLNFEDTLEILPLLGTTPPDFFAWLYGFEGKESVRESQGEDLVAAASGSPAQRSLDQRFERSLRVVKGAISRRQVWKEERAKI
ncbi:MAG TPA: helix-turn-helix domain-containing protein [Thermoanaerobaculia bacterium]|nr:helix-turn-helix domain-containing protein [Thermoanaerobaculia bacterium]